jgi:hypothetical protein
MKRWDNLEGTNADIRLAMHEMALIGGNKNRKAKAPIKFNDSVEEQAYLFDKVMKGKASMRELVYLSFLRGMVTEEQYADYLKIEKESAEYDNEDDGEDDLVSPISQIEFLV